MEPNSNIPNVQSVLHYPPVDESKLYHEMYCKCVACLKPRYKDIIQNCSYGPASLIGSSTDPESRLSLFYLCIKDFVNDVSEDSAAYYCTVNYGYSDHYKAYYINVLKKYVTEKTEWYGNQIHDINNVFPDRNIVLPPEEPKRFPHVGHCNCVYCIYPRYAHIMNNLIRGPANLIGHTDDFSLRHDLFVEFVNYLFTESSFFCNGNYCKLEPGFTVDWSLMFLAKLKYYVDTELFELNYVGPRDLMQNE